MIKISIFDHGCVKADQQKHNAFNSETGIMNHQVAEYNVINIMFNEI